MLKKTVTLESGITINDTLHVVNELMIDKNDRVSFRVDIHADITKPALDCFYDAFTYQHGDVKQEAYAYLKSKDAYVDA